jgi:hypothetical protein
VYNETVLLPFNRDKIKIMRTKVSMRLGWEYVRILNVHKLSGFYFFEVMIGLASLHIKRAQGNFIRFKLRALEL